MVFLYHEKLRLPSLLHVAWASEGNIRENGGGIVYHRKLTEEATLMEVNNSNAFRIVNDCYSVVLNEVYAWRVLAFL